MHNEDKLNIYLEKNKGFIFGIGLSAIICKFAVSNIFLIILILISFYQILKTKKFSFNKEYLPLILLYIWGCFSIFWTTQIHRTVSGIILTLPFFFFPIIFSQYRYFTNKDLKKMFRLFGISLTLYFFIGISNGLKFFFNEGKTDFFFYHNLVSIFDNNAIYISLFVAVTILFLFNDKEKTKTDYFIISLLILYLLLLSSKNIIVTTFALIIFQNLIKVKKHRNLWFIPLTLATLIATIFFIDFPIKERLINDLQLNFSKIWNGHDFFNYPITGLEVRVFLWRVMYEIINNNQLGFFGLGLNNINYLSDQYFSYYNVYKGYFSLNFHNQYLQTLGETGWPGLFLLLLIFIDGIYKSVKRKKSTHMLIFILIAISFISESFLARQKGILFFTIIFCTLLSNQNYKNQTIK